jgi:endonuclease/exonuclease/phosphatase family metal-dependent hydrolase
VRPDDRVEVLSQSAQKKYDLKECVCKKRVNGALHPIGRGPSRTGQDVPVRLVSYNIQSLRGSRAGVIDALRVAEPDVVCVQEVPRFLLPALRARRLAGACGLVAVGRGRVAAGTGIWVRQEIVVRRAALLLLSRTPRRRGLPATRTSRLHRRGMTWVELVVDGCELTVASVHLGLDATERARHAGEVRAALASIGGPYVLAGDLNEGPGGAAWRIFGADARPANSEQPTFPAGHPAHVIDTAFVSPGLTAVDVHVLTSTASRTASDHRPVQVTVTGSHACRP